MDRLDGPALVLDAADCVILARQLVEAIRLGYTVRSRPPPERLLDFANEVSRVARSAASCRATVQVRPRRDAAERRDVAPGRDSDQPVRLTIQEAAALAQVGESQARLWCRRGDVQASRGPRGAWEIDLVSLVAVMSARHRKEGYRKAAA
jgi:hypothetical protein